MEQDDTEDQEPRIICSMGLFDHETRERQMATDIQTLRPYLRNFDLTGLMVEGLGWNHHQSAPIVVIADTKAMTCTPSRKRQASPRTDAVRNQMGPSRHRTHAAR